MKKIIQHAKIAVIQRAIYEYYCDDCGKRIGTRDSRKYTWLGPNEDHHYCAECNRRWKR